MLNTLSSRDRWQLVELVDLAGSPEEVLDVVHELRLAGREPLLAEVVNTIMERKRQGILAAACADD